MGSAASVESEQGGKALEESDTNALQQSDYNSPQSETLKMLALGKVGYKDIERSYVNNTEFNHPPEVKWKSPENKSMKQITFDSPNTSTTNKINNTQAAKPPADGSQRIGPPPLRAPPPRRTMPSQQQPVVTGISGNPLTQQVIAPSIHPPPRMALQGPPQAYNNTSHQNDHNPIVTGTNSNTNTGRYTNRNATNSGNNSSRDPKSAMATAPLVSDRKSESKAEPRVEPKVESKVVTKEDHKKNEVKRQYSDDDDDEEDDDGDEQVYDWTVFDTADIKNTATTSTDSGGSKGTDPSHDKGGKSSMLSTKPIGGKNIPIKPFPYESNDYDDNMIASFANENPAIRDNFKKPAIVPSLSIPATNPDSSKHVNSGKVSGVGIVPPLRKISTPSAPNSAVSTNDRADSTPVARTVASSPIINNKNKIPASSPSPVVNRRPTAPKPNKEPPHAVIETNDVKRNKAQLPSTLTHAKPTTGDWLKKRYIVNNYILLDTLGTGSYGEVKLSKDRTTDTLYAVKIMSKDLLKKKKGGNSDETYFEDIKREIAIMKKLLHPNVLRLYEVLDDPNVNKMYLVLEYMKNGDLLNVLKERQHVVQSDGVTSLPDLELWNIFRQVVAGVRYLHFQNIVHGDIKPQNLLVGEDGVVKIADFGISKMLQGEEQKLVDAAGTPAFMSPELCKGESFSGQLADVWAIGATIFMLRFGSPPFVAGNVINLYAKIQNDPLVYPAVIDPGLRDLLDNMLLKDPLKRYTLRQVYTHHWLRQPPAFNKIKSNTASAHTDDAFKPPASYEKEEADAMGRPIDSVDNDELFMSIGVGNQKRVKTVQRSSGPLNEDNNGDLMKTNWGEDVFELVSDGSGSESDGDSDEEKSDTKTTPIAGRALFKGTASNLQTLSEENTEDIMASNMSTASGGSAIIERDEMSKEEEELRANRFKHKLKKAAPPPSLDIEKSDTGTEKSPTNSVKPVNKNLLTTPVTNRRGTNTSTPSSTPSLHNRKRFFSDNEDEVTNELSMEEFSQMMDTLAMQPKLRDIEESNTSLLGISINGADVNALYRNPNNGIGVAFHSEQGNRPTQEDRCILLPDVTKMRYFDGYEWESEDVATQLSKFTVGCVFDGHNGWRCSQYLCQNLAPMLIMHEQFLGKRMDQALTEVCHKLDDDICNILRQDSDMAGSTGVIAVYDGRKHVLTVANVGDSMCVLSRSGKAVKLNRMHRLDDEDEKLRVQKTGGTIVNNRVNGVLAITRAFGDVQFKGKVDEKKSSKLLNPVIATPDVYSEVITPMTEFAVIATDGLWDVYAPQAAINYVRKQLSKRYDLQAVTKGLVEEALARGSVDNVTVLIMSFHMS